MGRSRSGTARRGHTAGPRHDDRLPGTQTGHLPAQDGVGPRDPAHALRRCSSPVSTPPWTPSPGLDRRRHIEPYLTSLVDRGQSKNDAADHGRRPAAAGPGGRRNFLTDITEWGWADAPARRLMFRDGPAAAQVAAALPARRRRPPARRRAAPARQRAGRFRAAAAARLRAADRRTARPRARLRPRSPRPRRVAESAARQAGHRADGPPRLRDPQPGRPDHRDPLPGPPAAPPAVRRPAQFLFTRHGRRLSQNAVRDELTGPRKPPGSAT